MNRESVLPSMPKGETVGNIVIDGKGGSRCRDRNSYKEQRQMQRQVEAEETNIKGKGRDTVVIAKKQLLFREYFT